MGRSEKQNVKSLFYLFTAIMPHARIGSQDKYISAPTYSNMFKTENFHHIRSLAEVLADHIENLLSCDEVWYSQ
jgi:hypothetical protein